MAPYRGWWDIPGGFVEYAELPTDAALREAREETGLDVRLICQLGVWPGTYQRPEGLDRTLNFHYLAEVVGGVECAADDADRLAWFPLHNPPARLAWPEHARPALEAARRTVVGSGPS